MALIQVSGYGRRVGTSSSSLFLGDAIGRARAMIVDSRLNIARARDRIVESNRVLGRDGDGFNVDYAAWTNEQQARFQEQSRAFAEQREIDREVRLTILGLHYRGA